MSEEKEEEEEEKPASRCQTFNKTDHDSVYSLCRLEDDADAVVVGECGGLGDAGRPIILE